MKAYVKLLALAAGCGLALFGTPALAQDKPIELKLSHWGPPTHVNQKVFLPWAEMIEKKSGGKLKVTVFAGGVLGKPADHWDMGQNGVVDISWGTHNYTSGRFPLTSAMDLPFLTNSAKGGSRALHEFYLKHLQKEHEKVKVLWLQCPAPFHLHMTKKAALTPGGPGRRAHPHRRRPALRDRQVAGRGARRAVGARDLQRARARRGRRHHPALRGGQGLQAHRGDQARGRRAAVHGQPVHGDEPGEIQLASRRPEEGDRRPERRLGRRVRRRRLGQGRGGRPRGDQGRRHPASQALRCSSARSGRRRPRSSRRSGCAAWRPRACRPSRRSPISRTS